MMKGCLKISNPMTRCSGIFELTGTRWKCIKYNEEDPSVRLFRQLLEKISLTIETKSFELESAFSRVTRELNGVIKKSNQFMRKSLDCSEKQMLKLLESVKTVNVPTKKKCTDSHRFHARIINDSFIRTVKRCNERMVTNIEIKRNELEERLERAKMLRNSLKRFMQYYPRAKSQRYCPTITETSRMLVRVKKIYDNLSIISENEKSLEEGLQVLQLCHLNAQKEVTKNLSKLFHQTERCLREIGDNDMTK